MTESAMKSALDCFQNAARCEEKASASQDPTQRQMLISTARTWRSLGEAAKEREQRADLLQQHQTERKAS
jgi:3-dehydroquinate dehydratase